ncbi:MAG: DNA-binding protein [Clostridia bacterium]|nr:DNA-binding protein [Clostridia bacterium]
MSEKDMRFSLLLDFYGELLPPAQRDMIDLYYNEDLSLSEIAEQVGITRQGVRDSVRRSEETLLSYEEKLGMADRFEKIAEAAEEAGMLSELCKKSGDPTLAKHAESLLSLLQSMES